MKILIQVHVLEAFQMNKLQFNQQWLIKDIEMDKLTIPECPPEAF